MDGCAVHCDNRVADHTTATISIIIPTKNAGPEFRDTMAAIRKQTLEPEVVVVDSGSSDGTLDIAREFGALTTSIPSIMVRLAISASVTRRADSASCWSRMLFRWERTGSRS